MRVIVTIHEHGCEPRDVTLSRVPVPYEWVNVSGMKYQAVAVEHQANLESGVQAIVSVLREREAT